MAEIPRYRGPFRERQAERLLRHAGCGPKPGEAKRLARKGLNRAVAPLLDPPKAKRRGPAPADGDGMEVTLRVKKGLRRRSRNPMRSLAAPRWRDYDRSP
jgi:hypothetical protein